MKRKFQFQIAQPIILKKKITLKKCTEISDGYFIMFFCTLSAKICPRRIIPLKCVPTAYAYFRPKKKVHLQTCTTLNSWHITYNQK